MAASTVVSVARPKDSTPQQSAAFGHALAEALHDRVMSQADLQRSLEKAFQLKVHTGTISKWVNGLHEPSRTEVMAVEHLLDLRPGTLTRHFGYVPLDAAPVVTVPDAIEADAELTPRQREDLMAFYETQRARTQGQREKRQSR